MLLSTRARPYVCPPCQLRNGRLFLATVSSRPTLRFHRANLSTSRIPRNRNEDLSIREQADEGLATSSASDLPQIINDRQGEVDSNDLGELDSDVQFSHGRIIRKNGVRPAKPLLTSDFLPPGSRHYATTAQQGIELSERQQQHLNAIHNLRQKLSKSLDGIPAIQKDPSKVDGLPIDDVLKALSKDGQSPRQQQIIARLQSQFPGQPYGKVRDDLDFVSPHRDPKLRTVTDPKAKDVLVRLGVLTDTSPSIQDVMKDVAPSKTSRKGTAAGEPSKSRDKYRQSLASMVAPPQTTPKSFTRPAKPETKQPTFPLRIPKGNSQTLAAKDLVLSTVPTEVVQKLPQLSFDLSRVLFNPGVYHLQDPRSRVYNFDPYLEQLLPVSEFKFEELNPYQTSSEDDTLLQLAKDHGKRYVGSSSSMTSILSQFHFLLSSFRPLNFQNLTRGFAEGQNIQTSTTIISRSPTAIFLRYRDGVYAVDADKEYDEPNVLMSFGHLMEKLLTSEKEEFEKWKRTNSTAGTGPLLNSPEAFHYSEQGRFLLRSQLDAHDPRLPGTGYFDLKTRAVVGIRMNIREHEAGIGYQIKERFGTWESYEREYYDMARSTFLKYSLQARMGNMDGIFVAYHNITRMFGFQYIPLSEMDSVLHGQEDPCLGDQEFRYSIKFMEEIFNMATEKYPQKSLRIHFETREGTLTETKPYMNIFIEPMSEEDIQKVQESQKDQFEDFERRILHGEDPGPIVDVEGEMDEGVTEQEDGGRDEEKEASSLPVNTTMPMPTGTSSTAANTAFLDAILNTKAALTRPTPETREVMALKLTTQTKINERTEQAPKLIGPTARWTIDYTLERRSDEQAGKLYRQCRNRRSSALKTVTSRSSDNYYTRTIQQMSEKGAEWRKKQDELDAQREPVMLYSNR